MKKYFNPKVMIDDIKAAGKDRAKLAELLGSKYAEEMTSHTWGDSIYLLLGRFYTYELLCVLREVDQWMTLSDADSFEDIEVEKVSENHYTVRGKCYFVSDEIINKYFFDKATAMETYMNEGNGSDIVEFNNAVQVAEKTKQDVEALKELEKQEIAKLEAEFALKMSQMKQQFAEKMEPMVHSIGKSKVQLAEMEKSIYRMMSYKGMTYNLKQIAKGMNYGEQGPFVIWQKIRFLDEELPKFTLNNSDSPMFEDFCTFEELIGKYPVVRDFFLPSQKCCVAFQLSRNATVNSGSFQDCVEVKKGKRGKSVKTWTEYVASSFRLVNWNKVGLFVRNGENVYVLWLDNDKIYLSGDSLFLTQADFNEGNDQADFHNLDNVEEYEENKRGDVALANLKAIGHNYDERIKVENKFNARVYLLDVIQGIVDNKEILGLPEGQSVLQALQEGSYRSIIFNHADNYLEGLKWKNYEEFKSQFEVKEINVKDAVYVTINDGCKYRSRSTDCTSRSNDARIVKGVYTISVIEYHDKYEMYKDFPKDDFVEVKPGIYQGKQGTELGNYLNTNYSPAELYGILPDGTEVCIEGRVESLEGYRNSNYGKKIPDFDKYMSFRFREGFKVIKTVKKWEDPYESRKSDAYYGNGEDNNKVYQEYRQYHSREYRAHFDVDKDRCSREMKYFVKGIKSWGAANVRVDLDEFIPLKKITEDHLAYMMNNKFILPGCTSYADSLQALVEIKTYLENNKKAKK